MAILINISCPNPDIDEDRYHRDNYNLGYLCSRCSGVRQGIFPRPLDAWIINTDPPTCTLSPSSGSCGRIGKRDFVELVQPHLPPLALGAVHSKYAGVLNNYVTFYGERSREIVVYKYSEPLFSYCPACKRPRSAIWRDSGEAFVIRGELPDGQRAFQITRGRTICVTEELFRMLDLSRFEDLEFSRVDVLDHFPEGWPKRPPDMATM